MKIIIKNPETKAGQVLCEILGGYSVSGIGDGRRQEIKNTLGNLVVDGYIGDAWVEGVSVLDASLATPEQADDLYVASIMMHGYAEQYRLPGHALQTLLRWYVILHTLTPKRVVARLVQTHNDVVPERYHVTAIVTPRGYITLHHSEPLLRGYIDGDPTHIGLTTWVAWIDPLHCHNGEDIPLWSIMDAYERLSPDWAGHNHYNTYLHEYDARRMAGWRDDYWYAGGLTPQNYQDLFNVYWRDASRRKLVRKYGRKVKPLTYRR